MGDAGSVAWLPEYGCAVVACERDFGVGCQAARTLYIVAPDSWHLDSLRDGGAATSSDSHVVLMGGEWPGTFRDLVR